MADWEAATKQTCAAWVIQSVADWEAATKQKCAAWAANDPTCSQKKWNSPKSSSLESQVAQLVYGVMKNETAVEVAVAVAMAS